MPAQSTPVSQNYTPSMAKYIGTNINLKNVPKAKERSSNRWYHDKEKRKVLYVLCGSFACVMIIGALFAIPIVLVIELNKTTTTTTTISTISTAAPSPATSTNLSYVSNATASNVPNTTASSTLNTNVSYAPNTGGVAITTDTVTTNICQNMTCAFSSIASPMTSYYGVEHLNINCTESLSSMMIEIVVQRTVNASYANQYQTFWNLTTNQTYIQTNTQIIYTWTLLNGQIINGIGFPYYVEGQYNLPNVNQTTNLDTYSVTLTSVCGYTISQNGTF